MKGKIVLVHFPFTDLTSSKLRPALVLYESADDVIVAFISSKVASHILPSDLLLSADHPAFPSTGLKTPSVIKFDKVATVSKDLIEGEIGKIPKILSDECNTVMSRIFRV
jgi:mRNA interferase MazF